MRLEALAESIARLCHEGQVDKQGVDYIEHPKRIAKSFYDERLKVVAWLHDVLEDSPATHGYLRERGIPTDLVASCDRLMRRAPESYQDYIHRLCNSGDPIALLVKASDLRDNLRDGCPESLADRYRWAQPLIARAIERALETAVGVEATRA